MSDSRLDMLAGPDLAHRVITRTQSSGRRPPLELRPSGYLSFFQMVRREIEEGGEDDPSRHHVIVEQAVYVYSPTRDVDRDWVFRYEYERSPVPPRPHSHFHLNAQALTGKDLSDLHFPAGRLSIEQILAHLMHEHGVIPKPPLTVDDAIAKLAVTHRIFQTRRTDLTDAPFP